MSGLALWALDQKGIRASEKAEGLIEQLTEQY
jgi:hypothetical protein